MEHTPKKRQTDVQSEPPPRPDAEDAQWSREHVQQFLSSAQQTERTVDALFGHTGEGGDGIGCVATPDDGGGGGGDNQPTADAAAAAAETEEGVQDGNDHDEPSERTYSEDADGLRYCVTRSTRSGRTLGAVCLGFPPSHDVVCSSEDTISMLYTIHRDLETMDCS